MYQKTTLAKKRVPFIRLLLDLSTDTEKLISHSEYPVHESRATRLVGDSTRFMTVAFTKQTRESNLRKWLQDITEPGKSITYDEHEYVFLGFTENNLKSGHLLFFCEGPDFSVSELKEHFGSDLQAVYEAFGYGKYAARLGLSFSSTVATQEIEPEERHLLPDLKADDGSLTTDGCGLIRDSFAQETSVHLGVPFDTAVFQMRLGGIKGTLTRCPDELFDMICGCRGKKIAYRRSMVKYNGGPHILEVQNVSKPPKSGRLNKQFIALLLTLGIPLSVFENLLQMQLDEIDKITTDRQKALDCVDGEVDAEGDGFYQELYEMLLAGHDMNEPYLASQLRRFQNTSRDVLRKKLHISVKRSTYLLGVVDHCGVLKEGEVYINLPTKGGPQVGPIAAMRNPAYDPDGVRVLEAVNRPELEHLTNCIVFAASGARSEPDRMGGGDLDGDQYFVLFDPSLIPERRVPKCRVTAVSKPLTRSKTIAIGGRTQTVARTPGLRHKDMRTAAIETFVTMRCNFLLGSLSNEWMALVGTTPELADSPLCKPLVPMIEAALDIIKSGASLAILRSDFDLFKDSYGSMRTTVGWANPLDYLSGLVPGPQPTAMTDFIPDPQLILRTKTSEGKWNAVVQEAEEIMPVYNKLLLNAIAADREAKLQGLEEDDKRTDLIKANIIATHFPPVENILEDTPKYLLKASAWYFTGYKKGKQSFAWLGARWLNHIKASNCGHVPIAVGARSTPLAGPPTPPKVNITPRLPPTPVSFTRHSPRRNMQPVPRPVVAVDRDMEANDSNSDFDTDEFEVIDKDSVYDTAVEDLAPAVGRLRINTTPVARRILRENSDDTLVDPGSDSEMLHRLKCVPPSPVSPSSESTARPPTCGQRRMVASPEPMNVTTRPRTRAQTRALNPPCAPSPPAELPRTRARRREVSPTPAPKNRTTVKHTHVFFIKPNTAGRTRACECGVSLTTTVIS
ncbi:RNA-dependent RNA polymerase [Mycena venus]|uniref:RNA-dependent RNA polymerase n=1 Tax=Mycena venus TaxID=2733690 RepID=A0A8H7D2W1_9AGAR|nr:RNA-dependent RNA polymerase [Mycena venus]